MSKSSAGTRIINGKTYYLNGTISAYTPEQLEEKKVVERAFRKEKGQLVSFVKVSSIDCKVYTTLD